MKILAFDCAGAQCAAAVSIDGETAAEAGIRSERGHAQLLMPLLVRLAAEAGLTLRGFDRFAVTTGPGSFTGIRVALAAARGLALGADKPVVGITNFAAIAADAAQAGIPAPRLLIAIESRRAECFAQLFDPAGRPLAEPAMLAPEAIPAWLGPGAVALAGDAARRVLPGLPGATGMGARFDMADPAIVARLAAYGPAEDAPRPFYLRAPDAVPAKTRLRAAP